MAKIGEGDPRWIVEHRDDGKNVNAWHWVEKDVTDWSKSRIKELLENTTISSSESYKCKTTWMNTLEAEVTIYNRKGKLSFVMESNLCLAWEGELFDSEGHCIGEGKGKLTCPEIDHDSDPEKLQVDVTIGDKGADKLLEIMRIEGRKFIRAKIATFFQELMDGHGVQNKPKVETSSSGSKAQPKSPTFGPADGLAQFTQKLQWRAPPSEIWDLLINESKASAYTRSTAKITASNGGAFTFLGGSICGNFIELEPSKKMSMKWRLHDWAPAHHSNVVITFDSDEQGTTNMELQHAGIPATEVERTKLGWIRNFWEPIKLLFGIGYTEM